MCCGGIECSVDFYEQDEQPNWNNWTQKRIAESAHVVMVCSPQLIRSLKSDGRNDVRMFKGMFFSDSIVTTITSPKFVPVFLNNCEPRHLKLWIPPELHASRQYRLCHIRELHQSINPDEYSEDERGPRLYQSLQDSKHQELACLIRRLRGERDVVPPQPPQHSIPISPPRISPVLRRHDARG